MRYVGERIFSLLERRSSKWRIYYTRGVAGWLGGWLAAQNHAGIVSPNHPVIHLARHQISIGIQHVPRQEPIHTNKRPHTHARAHSLVLFACVRQKPARDRKSHKSVKCTQPAGRQSKQAEISLNVQSWMRNGQALVPGGFITITKSEFFCCQSKLFLTKINNYFKMNSACFF